MKQLVLAQICALTVWVASVDAQTLISRFSFEVITPPDSTGAAAGPFNADFGLGSARGLHASTATRYTTPIGNGSANAFSADHWGIGDYFQFTINTVGFSNIFVTFAMEGSDTGPSTFQLNYSSDGGMNFSTFGSAITISTAAFSSTTYNSSFVRSFDLSGILALNNNGNVVFRLVSTVAGSTTAGTARVDDFIVSSGGAMFVPEPSVGTWAVVGGIACVGVLAVRRRWRA